METKTPALISAQAAHQAVQSGQKIRFVDASFFLPNMGRNARAEFEAEHIANAVFFDLDAHSDHTSALPHTLPEPAIIARQFAALGLDADDWIICYDNSPFLSSARAWWMVRYAGHARVSILDGGLAQWRAVGGATETRDGESSHGKSGDDKQDNTPRGGSFALGPPLEEPVAIADIAHWSRHPSECQIVDARPQARFLGETPEPRAGMRSGHMPNALNVPITEILDPDTQCLMPVAHIEACFRQHGVDPTQPIATTCGSGVTACGLAFALHLLGHFNVKLYDGSWSEWGLTERDPEAFPVIGA